MTSRLEEMQNVREMMMGCRTNSLINFFVKNFNTINNMNLRSKYLLEIIKFTSKNIELKFKMPV